MIMQVGYEIDSEGNVGNETRRIDDLQPVSYTHLRAHET